MLLAAVQDVTVIVLLISGVVSTVLGLALEGQGGDSWIEVIVDGWSDVLSALPRVLFCHKSADIPSNACCSCMRCVPCRGQPSWQQLQWWSW